MTTIWDEAGAIPPTLTAEKLAQYARGRPGIVNEIEPRTGLTPLAAAIRAGNATTVNLLLENGADADKKTRDGLTPMYLAASAASAGSRPRMVQLLLAKYPKTFDEAGPASLAQGDTPLMAAARKKDARVIRLLVEQGASKTKTNADGKTARQIADEFTPAGLDVEKALQVAASKGRGGVVTYVDEWVLEVLAHYNVWGPLGGIFDSATRSYYDIPLPGPWLEDVAEPQTVADFKNNLENAVKRGGLERFFPPGDPYLQQVAEKAFKLKNDPKNLLNKPKQVDGLAKLALYQPILYCDDSWSMWVEEDKKGKGDRWRAQVELVRRISDVATRAVPDKRGCHLRFINTDTPTYNNLDKDRVGSIMANFGMKDGWTPIGTRLRENVLDPLVYPELNANTIKRPWLILITTDGYPTKEKAMKGVTPGPVDENKNEDPDRIRKEIRFLGKELENHGYRQDVVRFSISQIGKKISYTDDEEKVKLFLDGLESDPDIQDVLYRTAEIMDAKYDDLKGNEKNLEVFLLTTLLSPLQSLLN
ncbi:putative ankyrin repeat protein [Rosellinia necatrix]|uniref:Putative ankyrin repeat protein n=1 Tax=Rosellinia necatrix TaxID=77044 RepID=A0A1W2TRW0_ROSNE|nr:putative ankyrin repeat protein [Rosellinia necatrix]